MFGGGLLNDVEGFPILCRAAAVRSVLGRGIGGLSVRWCGLGVPVIDTDNTFRYFPRFFWPAYSDLCRL